MGIKNCLFNNIPYNNPSLFLDIFNLLYITRIIRKIEDISQFIFLFLSSHAIYRHQKK